VIIGEGGREGGCPCVLWCTVVMTVLGSGGEARSGLDVLRDAYAALFNLPVRPRKACVLVYAW